MQAQFYSNDTPGSTRGVLCWRSRPCHSQQWIVSPHRELQCTYTTVEHEVKGYLIQPYLEWDQECWQPQLCQNRSSHLRSYRREHSLLHLFEVWSMSVCIHVHTYMCKYGCYVCVCVRARVRVWDVNLSCLHVCSWEELHHSQTFFFSLVHDHGGSLWSVI